MNLETLGDDPDNSKSHMSNDKGHRHEENGDYEVPDEIIIQPNNIDSNPLMSRGKFQVNAPFFMYYSDSIVNHLPFRKKSRGNQKQKKWLCPNRNSCYHNSYNMHWINMGRHKLLPSSLSNCLLS